MTEARLEWLGYATTGKEFVAGEDLARFGIDHWIGTRIEFERRGKQRTAEPYEYPAIHNYVWLRPTHRQVAALSEVRFLGRTFHFLNAASVAALNRFRAEVEAREARQREIIRQQEQLRAIAADKAMEAEKRRDMLAARRAMLKAMMAEYRAGDTLEIRDGILAGEMARFRRLSLGAGDVHPFIEAEIEMLGRVAVVQIDPLSVRRQATA